MPTTVPAPAFLRLPDSFQAPRRPVRPRESGVSQVSISRLTSLATSSTRRSVARSRASSADSSATKPLLATVKLEST